MKTKLLKRLRSKYVISYDGDRWTAVPKRKLFSLNRESVKTGELSMVVYLCMLSTLQISIAASAIYKHVEKIKAAEEKLPDYIERVYMTPQTVEVFNPRGRSLGMFNQYEYDQLRIKLLEKRISGYSVEYKGVQYEIDKYSCCDAQNVGMFNYNQVWKKLINLQCEIRSEDFDKEKES